MQHQRTYTRQKASAAFQTLEIREEDELFPIGIFEFNISRLEELIASNPDKFPIEITAIAPFARVNDSSLDQNHIPNADLSRPIILAEIAPGRFSLIDGNHRVAKATRAGIATLPAFRVWFPDHVAFLTSQEAYFTYIEYWNEKVDNLHGITRRRRRQAGKSKPRA
ncbi:MAG: hypothetical protein KGJ57_22395 [Sphingomonadales bacterium]|nr:hypothetical protein [Sphingomonadales bacterium]MDE2172136.1 hypothetical protein [Sphingomonadales bacterium]